MNFTLVPIDLSDLIQEAVDANESYANTMNVSFKTFGIEKTVLADGDQDRLMQVMTNILSNAVKFSKTDGVV